MRLCTIGIDGNFNRKPCKQFVTCVYVHKNVNCSRVDIVHFLKGSYIFGTNFVAHCHHDVVRYWMCEHSWKLKLFWSFDFVNRKIHLYNLMVMWGWVLSFDAIYTTRDCFSCITKIEKKKNYFHVIYTDIISPVQLGIWYICICSKTYTFLNQSSLSYHAESVQDAFLKVKRKKSFNVYSACSHQLRWDLTVGAQM